MKCSIKFVWKYSDEIMRNIKALKFKYFTIGLECRKENVLIANHFHKCELKEKLTMTL